MDINKYMKDMLGIAESSLVDSAMDIGFGAAPIISKIHNAYKMNKFQGRLNAHDKQLIQIKEKIERSENEVFYKAEVFPLIVGKLIDEDEDIKAMVIIDGFEHIVDEDVIQIEKVYHYYDVLSELRFSDIMFFSNEYIPLHMQKIRYKIPNVRQDYKCEDLKKEREEMQGIQVYQKNKFERLGLVEALTLDELKDNRTISDFGINFVDFFVLGK